jgi:hypothetical protein
MTDPTEFSLHLGATRSKYGDSTALAGLPYLSASESNEGERKLIIPTLTLRPTQAVSIVRAVANLLDREHRDPLYDYALPLERTLKERQESVEQQARIRYRLAVARLHELGINPEGLIEPPA